MFRGVVADRDDDDDVADTDNTKWSFKNANDECRCDDFDLNRDFDDLDDVVNNKEENDDDDDVLYDNDDTRTLHVPAMKEE